MSQNYAARKVEVYIHLLKPLTLLLCTATLSSNELQTPTQKKRQFSDTHIFTFKKIQYTHGLSSKIRMVQITSILCYIIQSCQKSIIGHMVWMQVQQLRMHCHHMSATAENRVLIGVYCWVEERANQHHLCLIVGDAVTAKRRRRNLHKKETQACMENGQMHSPIFACLLALGIHWPLILKSPSF